MTEIILSFPQDGGMTLSTVGIQGPGGGSGGGGVSDGDKGDITVSGSGAAWTIDAGVVSLSKMADLATSTILGRATAGTGSPEALTAAQVRTILNVADGATANASDAFLLARANHTGTQAASTITGLAAIATSGSAADLTAGTLPAARFDDTAHGSRAGGALHANVVAAGAAGFMTGADKTKLDAITGTNTGDVTLAGTPNYLTIVGQVITRALIDLASHVTGKLPFANIADMANGTLFYRKTAGAGAPETQTLATLKTDLGLTGTNSGDQTITLTGMVTGSGTGSFATSLGSFTKAQLDAAVSDGNVLYVGDVTTNATHTGDATGATALTLATVNANVGAFGSATQVATFTVDGKGRTTAAANVAISIPMTAISDSTAAGRAVLGAATATAQTALFDLFTSAAKGLAPASGGGTTNFLRADGSWAAPGGGGAPGGSTGEIQYNNAGAFAGAADVEIEGGQLRLPSIATPTAPAADGIKLYSKDIVGCDTPAYLIPSAQGQAEFLLQRMMGQGNFLLFLPGGGTTVTSLGAASTGTGTATAANVTNSTKRQRLKRIEYLVTVAATTAVAGWYHNASQHTVGGGNAWEGGFTFSMFGGPATGVATASSRFFMGMRDAGGPTDVEPSTFLRCIGIGYDSADTNLQFMHNDATGTATKIDLGASFAVPTTDRSVIWRLRMFSPPGTTQQVDYEVLDIDTGAIATGTVTTDLPSTTSFISPRIQSSAGGTSSVIGVAVGPVQVHVEL